MSKKALLISLSVLGAIQLSGCATPHACPLPEGTQHCHSVMDTIKKAKEAPRDYTGVSIFLAENENQSSKREDSSNYPIYKNEKGELVLRLASPEESYNNKEPIARKEGRPIYRQAEPRQIWLPAWTDANGVLHGDKEVYTLKPGGWNYGSMKKAGAGSDVLGPVEPDQYGFEPVYEKDIKKENVNTKQQANRPKEERKPEPIVVDNKVNVDKATTTVNNITQPYQKLED